MHGDEPEPGPASTQLRKLRVRLVAEQGGELGPVAHPHRIGAHVGLRRGRAPPVQVSATRAPAAPVVLPDGRDQHPGPVRAVHPVLGPPHGQLPAHVGLDLQRVPLGAQGQPVQRAPRTAGEVRPIEEHAGAPDRAGALGGLALDLVELDVATEAQALPPQLPVVGGQLGHGGVQPRPVVRVGEERAVGATAVVRSTGDGPVARRGPEHARPAREQPREVGAHHVLGIGGVDELDPLAREVGRDLGHESGHSGRR